MVTRPWSILDFLLVWLGGLVGSVIFGAIGDLLDNPDWAIALLLAGQYVGNIAVFAWLARTRGTSTIGLEVRTGDILYIGLGLVLQVTMAALFYPLNNLLFPDGRPEQEVARIIADADTLFLQVTLVAAAVVLGPITEEVMYRGILLKTLQPRGRWFTIILTSVVFAAVHLTGLDPDQMLASAAVFLPPLFLLGMLLAWVTLRTGRLGPAIFIHSGWNLLSAIVLLLPAEMLEQFS
ncbi:MAG TPA: type II CAAX endopeptidase family protein [Acidimicrobiia bacterium]|nr:type II CAAX endopeptidase family protein [Acidimicrobiia bacterium]